MLYLLNNEDDDFVCEIDCLLENYEQAEAKLLPDDFARSTFCGHLYYLKLDHELVVNDKFRVIKMSLDEYITYWTPYVNFLLVQGLPFPNVRDLSKEAK